MPKIITTNDLNKIKFYQIPKAFFHNPLYSDMKNDSKIAYAILRDLLDLSIKNNWINENNEIYVKLSREKMMKYLQIKGTQKYAEVMKELLNKELIVKRTLGLNRVDETYVCIPEELDIIYNDEELLDYEENVKKCEEILEISMSNPCTSRRFENQTSGSLKIKPQEVRKSNLKKFENQTHTNTNTTNTNNIKTTSSSNNLRELEIYFENNICELKKSTKIKFNEWCVKLDKDFVISLIDYGAETNAKSYKWFDDVVAKKLNQGIDTADKFKLSIEEFRMKKEKELNKKKNYSKDQKSKDNFNNYEQRKYDFNALEEKILNSQEKKNKVIKDVI